MTQEEIQKVLTRNWVVEWLFKRSVEGLEELLNLTAGTEREIEIKHARAILVGALMKLRGGKPTIAKPETECCTACGSKRVIPSTKGWECQDCQAFVWYATEPPIATVTNVDHDTKTITLNTNTNPALETLAEALGYRVGQTQELDPTTCFGQQRAPQPNDDYNYGAALKIKVNSDGSPAVQRFDFSGYWKTRSGDIVSVGQGPNNTWETKVPLGPNTICWNKEGKAENPDNDLVERILPGAMYKKLF